MWPRCRRSDSKEVLYKMWNSHVVSSYSYNNHDLAALVKVQYSILYTHPLSHKFSITDPKTKGMCLSFASDRILFMQVAVGAKNQFVVNLLLLLQSVHIVSFSQISYEFWNTYVFLNVFIAYVLYNLTL